MDPRTFLACKAPTAATLIKRRHLELIGYNLVSVTPWEWNVLSGMDERRKYLEGKLQCNVGVDSAAHTRQEADRPSSSTKAPGVTANQEDEEPVSLWSLQRPTRQRRGLVCCKIQSETSRSILL